MKEEKFNHEPMECCGEKHLIYGSDDCCDAKKIVIKIPFGRKNINDMKDFFMLKILSDHEGDGITGYELGKLPDMTRGSVIRKMEELKEQGLLRSEEEYSDGKTKKKYFITEEGKRQFETLWGTFQETFSFLGDDVPFEHFIKPIFQRHIHGHEVHFIHDIDQLETKEEVKDYLVSMRHKLNIVQKRLQPRLEKLHKARAALDEAIEKVDHLSEFSQQEVKKILSEIRDTYQDVWDYRPE